MKVKEFEENTIQNNTNQSSEELETTKQLYFHLGSQDEAISKANDEYKPHIIARYTLDLCQMINSFYQKYHIINPDNIALTKARIDILQDTHLVLGKMMDIL